MRWLLRTFTGLGVALLVLSVGGYVVLNHLLTQFTTPPPRPTFANDDPKFAKNAKKANSSATNRSPAPVAKPSPSPQPKPSPLPPGAFEGRVTQPIGLILRDSPDPGAASIGGLDYNQPTVVLSTSNDGRWQKVRVGSQEGWVKAGNIEKN
jgi:hypothetical protein